VEEFPHADTTKSDTCAEGFTFTELEVGDGLLRECDGRALAGDFLDLVDGVIDCDFTVRGFSHAGSDHDLFETWDLMAIGVSVALHESRNDLGLVVC